MNILVQNTLTYQTPITKRSCITHTIYNLCCYDVNKHTLLQTTF